MIYLMIYFNASVVIMEKKTNQTTIRTKTRQEIAYEYGIGRKTLCRWMKRAGLQVTNGLLCPLEVEEIYYTFGKSYSADNGTNLSAKQS